MKIIGVGMNYALHKEELKDNSATVNPIIFMKPESALLKEGKPFFIPDFATDFQYETELVVRINRLGKNIASRFASRYYEEVTVGIDLTARDLQNEFRAGGLPWELAKGFDGSAVIGDFIPVNQYEDIQKIHFSLRLEEDVLQKGYTGDMLFSVDEIIAYVSRFMTLKIGDLIFTGTPQGVGSISIGQELEGYLEDKKVLHLPVR